MAKQQRAQPPKADPKFESWGFSNWPANVWPGDGKRARSFIRQNRDALAAAGCITRAGREIVVFAVPFNRFLVRQAYRVQDFDIALNRPAALKERVARQKARYRERAEV
jgi:hypothetical protein